MRNKTLKDYSVLYSLFSLNKEQLIYKLKSICSLLITFDFDLASITKTIKEDVPFLITVDHYASLNISPFGINYQPEHGEIKKIVTFNKHFAL